MSIADKPVIAIVLPCYNEEDALPSSVSQISSLLERLAGEFGCSQSSFAVFVDDGSRDDTWKIISEAAKRLPGRIHGLHLARNAGHQNALIAGLTYVTDHCDAAISVDADLQDDLDALPIMINEYRKGAHIVLGIKKSRADDPMAKVLTAAMYNKLMRFMGVDLVENHADCRLLSNRALKNLGEFPERFLFLRGVQTLLHTKTAHVYYDLKPRSAGSSKYSPRKMISLALNGITSFTVVPLRLITGLGALVFAFASVMSAFALLKAVSGDTIPGWASVTIPLYLLGGLNMMALGIVGEYIGKIYFEVKRRPRYLIDDIACESEISK